MIDTAFLRRFEATLDPRDPESGPIPARILGHGEITTVLRISPPDDLRRPSRAPEDAAGAPGARTVGGARAVSPDAVACKRMPMFRSGAEAAAYDSLYAEYERVLREEIGLELPASELVWLGWEPPPAGEGDSPPGSAPGPGAPASVPIGAGGSDGSPGAVVLYIVQELLPPSSVGHQRLRTADESEARALLEAVLQEMDKVFSFNEANRGRLEVGFDGQISNWAVVADEGTAATSAGGAPVSGAAPLTGAIGAEPAPVSAPDAATRPAGPAGAGEIRLRYFDTSTPLLRRDDREQLDPELFLRSAPSFLVWIIRRFMLADVMERYYDRRKVAVDLVANLFKEQRPDLVPDAVRLVNDYLGAAGAAPVTEDEVRAYYREDARIWRVYLAFRKVDRLLHRLLGKEYPYILPGKVVR